jgi:hypothetical protein
MNAARNCKCASHPDFSAKEDSICELAVRPGAIVFFRVGAASGRHACGSLAPILARAPSD